MKIVNSKKFMRSLMLVIGLILLFTISLSNNTSFSKETIEYKEIYTSDGDTLWSLAKEEAKNNDYYLNKDLRFIVKDIKKVNSLNNSELGVGQKLKIPIG